MTDCQRIRFMENNFSSNIKSFSSQLTALPASNVSTDHRARAWVPEGCFEITTSNQTLYVNDGTERAVVIPVGKYTPTTLIAQIKTSLGGAWSISHSSTTFKFTLSNTSSVTLRHTITTNSIWDTLGFTQTTDKAGTSFEAQESRRHTSEYIVWDLGIPTTISFFSLLGKIDEALKIAPTATVKLMADNVNHWQSPAFTLNLTPSENGIMSFLTSKNYRFWKLKIIDRLNPITLQIGNIYLGDYLTLSLRNVGTGFTKQLIDTSVESVSDFGSRYYTKKPKFYEYSNLNIHYISASDREKLENFFLRHGKTKPFYIALDPALKASRDIYENTRYVRFETPPQMTHIKTDTYTLSFKVREAL